MTWQQRIRDQLDEIDAAGLTRSVRDLRLDSPVEGTLVDDGRHVVAFASNDYLGLTRHPSVIGAAHEALERSGAGAGASRLVVGARPEHRHLEESIADWKATSAALLFPTGFAANLGVLTTLGGPGVRILSDAWNHASIIDGARLARADVAVYPHGDMAALSGLLRDAPSAVVVSDTVFSMDGDEASVSALEELCSRHDALLVLDEAHAVLGPDLDGGATPDHVVRVGTLSKTLGALGGFAAATGDIVHLLVNRARPFIFTTAPTPADTAAASAALDVVRSSEGDELRARLRSHVEHIAPGHPSPIVPVILGSEQAALDASAALLDEGLLVPAIRPPTVPPGTSRLRVALSAAHSAEQVAQLASALDALPETHAAR
ncbi:MAG: 8-amino-7-oxononanoate synthase [Acidimicrobiia bacterium]